MVKGHWSVGSKYKLGYGGIIKESKSDFSQRQKIQQYAYHVVDAKLHGQASISFPVQKELLR